MSERILEDKNLVVRHSVLELFEHWSIALSGILLILTGLFEMPIARRYYINELPGLGWSADFIISSPLMDEQYDRLVPDYDAYGVRPLPGEG